MKLDHTFYNTPIAHRGLHNVAEGFPENSLDAIKRALSFNYGVEIDVQISADKKAVVFHDYKLDRLTNKIGLIREKTFDELKSIFLLGSKNKIPLLSDVLNIIDGKQPVLIEIKDQDGQLGSNVGDLEKEVSKVLSTYNGPVAVMSFNPYSLKAYRSFGGLYPIGLVTEAFCEIEWPKISIQKLELLRELVYFDQIPCDFISHNFQNLDSHPVEKLRNRGVPILSWTIKSVDDEVKARKKAINITFEGYMAKHI